MYTYKVRIHPNNKQATKIRRTFNKCIECQNIVYDYLDSFVKSKQKANISEIITVASIGLVISADEPFCVFPPNCTYHVNREVIGIITGIDKPDANVPLCERWLKNCGCKKLFYISSYTGEGLSDIIDFLNDDK